jgi:aminocarboxymuconate-semialdehyde decarboxylase
VGAIDVHTHFMPPGWEDLAARYGGTRWPRLVRDAQGGCTLYIGDTFNRNLGPNSFEPAARIADIDRLGVQRQLLSPPPPLFTYWADGKASAEFCRIQNDAIAAAVAAHPSRFLGAATLPLQAPDLAVREMERARRELGFRCIEICTNVEGRDLDDDALTPVWEAALALDLAIFVHPGAPVLGAERFRRHNLPLVAGNPLETALAMTRIVYGGIVERFPDLRWCFAHGGGAFAFALGRIDHGWNVMPEGRAAIARPPSEYARRFWVDSLTHSPAVLRFVVDTFGADHVVLASDYPYRMGYEDPIRALDAAGLAPAVRERILEPNALAFLGMSRA